MSDWTDQDREHMRLALELARRGEGRVEPNPMVGCVIAKANRIVGQGHHKRFGGPHAERHALRQAGATARGATAFVTLEPCDHHGKTPPCTEALIRAGIGAVIVAMKDPNHQVAGRGLRRLRRAGIDVRTGLLRREAMGLLAPYIKYHQQRRPYVILKWAQSLDGKIATRSGESKWITSRQSRAAGHKLRARVDAVVVGIGTVLADDPMLTARWVRPRRTATRVVLDRRLRIPTECNLVRTAAENATLIACAGSSVSGRSAKKRKIHRLEQAGCEIVAIPSNRHGLQLDRLLGVLWERGMTNILVEGGSKVLGSFVRENLADEARIFVAPKLIGGRQAPGPLGHRGPSAMSEIIGTSLLEAIPCGPDMCYHVRFHRGGM